MMNPYPTGGHKGKIKLDGWLTWTYHVRMSKLDPKGTRLTLRIPDEAAEVLLTLCRTWGVSRTNVLVRLILAAEGKPLSDFLKVTK